ncbi:MAG: exodeoxyribonuclease III [Candidatus Pacebacteria bacterium]|nr:exodeoxyribonuclease III [Candidatus Paceibacterota bacterium]
MKRMKLISWNVNGIRASYKKGALQELFALNADIIGIQETKSTIDQLGEEIISPPGYVSYFDSAKERKGYSGVAVYTKIEPEEVIYGLGEEEYDTEGRCLTLIFEGFAFVTAYFPNGGRDEDHFQFKLRYYDKFLKHVKKLEEEYGAVVFCGDLNVAHEEIDLARPKENAKQIGFLPIERAWVTRVIEAGFVDTFRVSHPERVKYSWWDQKTHARERNVGWRIDYMFVSKSLAKHFKNADILDEMLGSDHAPVVVVI